MFSSFEFGKSQGPDRKKQEMPEPLKNVYNEEFIDSLSTELKILYRPLEKDRFKKDIFDEFWDEKELKDRMHHLAIVVGKHLPENYEEALAVLNPFARKSEGFEYMFIPDFIELRGLDDYSVSI